MSNPQKITEAIKKDLVAQIKQDFLKRIIHIDQSHILSLEKQLDALNPYFKETENSTQETEKSTEEIEVIQDAAIQNIPKQTISPSTPHLKTEKCQANSESMTPRQYKSSTECSFSKRLVTVSSGKLTERAKTAVKKRTIKKVKSAERKPVPNTSEKTEKIQAPSTETYKFFVNSERDAEEKYPKKKSSKITNTVYSLSNRANAKRWEPISASRSPQLVLKQPIQSTARVMAHNIEPTLKCNSKRTTKPIRKAHSADSPKCESSSDVQELFNELNLEEFRRSAEQYSIPHPKSRDSTPQKASQRSPLKLNSQDIARIKEESKELAHFQALKTPLKLLNDKLDVLNTKAEKVLRDKGGINMPSNHSSTVYDDKVQPKLISTVPDYQIEQIEDENDRLYKILFKERSNLEQQSCLSFGSVDIEPRNQIVHPQKCEHDLSITESMIQINPQSNRSSTHASAKNLLSQLNPKPWTASPVKKAVGLLELHLNRIEEIDSHSTSLKQNHRGDKVMVSPTFGYECRFESRPAETIDVIKSIKNKIFGKNHRTPDEVFTFTKSNIKAPRF